MTSVDTVSRVPALGLRLVILLVLSIVLMVLDHRQNHLGAVRQAIGAAVYPLQVIVDSPFRLWAWIRETRTPGFPAKRQVSVTPLDESRNPVQTWVLQGCAPMKYTGPTLAGKGGTDVAMEELVLSVEGFEIEAA